MLKEETIDSCILCNSISISSVDYLHKICVCANCGHVFNNPRPTLNSIKKFYSRSGKTNSWMGDVGQEKAWDRLALRRLKKILKLKKCGLLLDVGCGNGRFINTAQKSRFRAHGIEVSNTAVDIAKISYGLELFCGNIDSFDFGSKLFDVITLWHSLEHLPYPGRTLVKIKSILKSGGYLVIAVPNDDGYWFTRRFKNLFLPQMAVKNKLFIEQENIYNKWKIDVDCEEIHLSHFTPPVLVNYLKSIDFIIKDVSLDSYFVASGISLYKNYSYYFICKILYFLTNANLYDTILISAQKR